MLCLLVKYGDLELELLPLEVALFTSSFEDSVEVLFLWEDKFSQYLFKKPCKKVMSSKEAVLGESVTNLDTKGREVVVGTGSKGL